MATPWRRRDAPRRDYAHTVTAAPGPAPRDAVARAVRADIVAGRLAPGTRLREADLAARFGVSRVPVREALAQLRTEGFVMLERYRGATVAVPSGTAAAELLQVRRGLEVLAAQLAARRRGGEVAAELARVAGPDHPAPRFHELVAEASGNGQLRQLLDRIRSRIAWLSGPIGDHPCGDHTAIARAVLTGAPVQAGFLMDEHLAAGEALLDAVDD